MNLQEETIIGLETGPIYSIKGKGGRQKEDLETFFLRINCSLSLSSGLIHCFCVLWVLC